MVRSTMDENTLSCIFCASSIPRDARLCPVCKTFQHTCSCTSCASPIPQGARLCPVCKTFQRTWQRRFQFWASVTALVVAGGAFLSWGISLLPQSRRALFPREQVRVVSYNSLQSVVLANDGDREVFLSHILLYMTGRPQWQAKRVPLERGLAPGQFLRQEVPERSPFDSGEFVRGVPPEQWDAVVSRALQDEQCYQVVFFVAGDS